MKRITGFAFLLCLLGVSCREARVKNHEDWKAIFQRHGVSDGCFIIRDHTHELVHYYNKERCLKRFSPASTFKIFSSLVALETGKAQDETFVIPWDGTVRSHPEWNKDMSMLEAFKLSNVGYYQELARRIALPDFQFYLDTVQYGNMRTGKLADQFWLNDTLQISADEQIGFLRKLYFDELPFTERSQRIVKYMMQQEETPQYKLAWKTGWSTLPGKQDVLWVVGWADKIEHLKEHKQSTNVAGYRNYPYFFALNFSTSDTTRDWAAERISLLKALLGAAGAIPEEAAGG